MTIFDKYGKKLIVSKTKNNPWAGTPIESVYAYSPKDKGSFGEDITKQLLTDCGYKVEPRINAEHDCIVNGIKTEIKFSLATKRNYDNRFTFNHIGLQKDWEQIIFVGINGDGTYIANLYKKENLPKDALRHQQGGKNSQNDDYMIMGKNCDILFADPHKIDIFCSFAKFITFADIARIRGTAF